MTEGLNKASCGATGSGRVAVGKYFCELFQEQSISSLALATEPHRSNQAIQFGRKLVMIAATPVVSHGACAGLQGSTLPARGSYQFEINNKKIFVYFIRDVNFVFGFLYFIFYCVYVYYNYYYIALFVKFRLVINKNL